MSTASVCEESRYRPLYLILGPSGCGKSRVVDRVCRMMRVNKVISATTRPRRSGEPEDSHYFVSDREFDRLMKPPYGMAAVTTYDGYRYGATLAEIESGDLYIIDPAGAHMLRRSNIRRPVTEIVMELSEDECRDRLLARGYSPEQAERRLSFDSNVFLPYMDDIQNGRFCRDDVHFFEMWEESEEGEDFAVVLADIIASNWPE